MKEKLLLDASIMALLLLCMEYGATGPFLHELIGVILILGMITHFLINRKYYNILRSGKINKIKTRAKIAFVFNMILPVSLVTMFISSVVISKDIFSFLGITAVNYEPWRILHIVSACVMLITSVAHLIMHVNLFKNLKNKHIKGAVPGKILTSVSCLVAFLIGLYTIKTTGGLVSDNIIASSDGDKSQKIQPSETEKTNNTEKTEPYVVTEIPDTEKSVDFTEAITENDIIVTEENPIDDEPVITEEQAEEKPSLEEYLGNLICTGCGKRCSLLAPRCRKGEMQAQSAMEDYEEMYSSGF